MYRLVFTRQFKKDLKKVKLRKNDFELVSFTLKILQEEGVQGISSTMHPHRLKCEFINNWECHIKPDLLIIWIQIERPKEIKLVRLGSHSELFQ